MLYHEDMSNLKELQGLAKELEHPPEQKAHKPTWEVTKVKGTPNQYELTYGGLSQKFYYIPHPKLDDYGYGPRTTLSIARYLLLKENYESTKPNKLIDSVMDLAKKLLGNVV